MGEHAFVLSSREKVLALIAEGCSQAEVVRRLGLSKGTVAYHVRRVLPPDPRFRRRYDWREVQRYYDEGHSITGCQERFGFSRETWNAARLRGDVVPRPHAMPLARLLVVGRVTNRRHLRGRLIVAGLKEERCEVCGLDAWCRAPLVLQLHHVNGDGLDNRLENLQLLCPNCHSQTENWGGRNRRRGLPGRGRGQDSAMNEHPERDEDETTDAAPAGGPGDEVEDLESDPAYNPQDEGLKDIKGG